MTALPVEAVTSYLQRTGWYAQPQTWQGLTIWGHDDGGEVVVPARDGLKDAELRTRELLDVVAALEGRAAADVALDISGPPADLLTVRTHPADSPSGWSSLSGAFATLASLTSAFHATARAVDQGAFIGSRGRLPKKTHDLVDRLQVGPVRPGSCLLPVRVPAEDFARDVLVRLNIAVAAVSTAATSVDVRMFRHVVTAGASADLCEALAGFAGRELDQPFGLAFRWAGDAPEGTSETVTFDAGTGERILAGARFLRETTDLGQVTVTGLVRVVRPDWTVRIDELWARLPDLTAYDAAVTARRVGHRVTASGALHGAGQRVELLVDHFTVIG